jgi:hypothetical protein
MEHERGLIEMARISLSRSKLIRGNVKFPSAETLGNWENLTQLNITANST